MLQMASSAERNKRSMDDDTTEGKRDTVDDVGGGVYEEMDDGALDEDVPLDDARKADLGEEEISDEG